VTTSAPQLDYALGGRRRLPRRVTRALVGIAVAVVLAIPVYRYGPPLVRNFSLRHHYSRAAAYTPPAGQIVYDTSNPTPFKPPVWGSLTDAFRMAPPGGNRSLLFLHSRRTAGGVERLLILEVDPLPDGEVKIRMTAVPPVPIGPRHVDASWTTWGVSLRRQLGLSTGYVVRIYAATADTGDPSSLTFDVDRTGLRYRARLTLVDAPSSASMELNFELVGPTTTPSSGR
jgi:hypothetical protein